MAQMQMQLPMLTGALREQQRAKLVQAVEAIEQGLAAQSIPNAVYLDIKGTVARAIERGWMALLSEPYLYAGRWESIPENLEPLTHKLAPPPHLVASYLDKVEAIQSEHPYHRDMRAYLLELQPLAAGLIRLKEFARKRDIRPAEEIPEGYTPPAVRGRAQQQILALLEDVTAHNHAELRADFVRLFSRYLNDFIAADRIARGKGEAALEPHRFLNNPKTRTFNPEAYSVVDKTTSSAGRGLPYERRADAAEIIAAMAGREADLIRRSFVHSNFAKIASIVDRKANFRTGEVVGQSLSLTGMSGTLRFSFEDGSSFVVKNAVVWSISIRGRPFRRFPITFHDAILPDGSRMPRPDEESMNEVFAVATSPEVPGPRL